MPRGSTLERFVAAYSVDDETGCWVWQRHLVRGYGMIRPAGGAPVYAHRWAYEHFVGPIPEGMVLDHFACDRPSCVNPEHVRPVTRRENTLRGGGVAARNLAKTRCDSGHPFDDRNTRRNADGSRSCRACNREAARG